MRAGIQTFFAEAGEAACYGFGLIDVGAEFLHRELDPCQSLLLGIDKKRIHYSWEDEDDDNNFYVDDPEGFLEDLTGYKWTVRKEAPDYIVQPGDFIIERWERQKTGLTICHFKRPHWNSLVHSESVRIGKLVSLRVCRLA